MPKPLSHSEWSSDPPSIHDLPVTEVPLPADYADPTALTMTLAPIISDDAPPARTGSSSMLGMLAGVTVDDGGADDLLERRIARDRPRLALEPRHAIIIILILVVALSLSLTLLVQQGMRLSAMSWKESSADTPPASSAPTDSSTSSSTSSSPPASAPPQNPSESQPQDSPSSGSDDNDHATDPSPIPTSTPTSTLIDLNTATVEELQTIKGVGPVTAQRIVDHRNRIGRYTSVDQLLDVSGIGAKTLEKIRPYVEVRP
ncbi:ComEA family DNA-binding protein [Bifidobacterium tissieri]|nr:helix-hairpin-helix domain-containing protein [Bifidobacterium tissieri]